MAKKQTQPRVSTEAGAIPAPVTRTRHRAKAPALTKDNEAQAAGSPLPHSDASEHEEIARLAYSYWEARGCTGGSAEEDWLRAEREYRRRREA
jgi:hypothetical protein